MNVPFLDLVAQHRPLEDELVEICRRAFRTGGFVGGPEVACFEKEFATLAGTANSVAVASGTDALRFAYMAMGVKAGDEIITVPNTFIATTEAMTQAGATFRFVDVDPETLLMDPAALEAAIGPRTVGIVPVHLYGQMADMDPILDIARKHGLWVIEDAAQAHGAQYKGKLAGSIGALAGFSFYPGKNLGACGEGGAVSGSDEKLLAVIRRIRDHGQSTKYYHETEGYNGRLDAIQAGILRVKLRHINAWNQARAKNAEFYREALTGISGIRVLQPASYGTHVYHLFVILADRRDELQAFLKERGVATGLHYPVPLHLQDAYRDRGWKRGDFPVTEDAGRRLLSLPMFPELTGDHIEYVAKQVRAFYSVARKTSGVESGVLLSQS